MLPFNLVATKIPTCLSWSAQREQGINVDLNWGSFRKREITFRVLEATADHVLSCLSIHGQRHSPAPSSSALPVKCTLTPFSLTATGAFWYKGIERKLLPCSSGHFSHVLLALNLSGSDMSASFHITWPFRHGPPWLCYFASDPSTCLFPPRSNVLCISISMDQKGSY